MNVKEFSKYMGVGTTTVHGAIKEGRIAAKKVGRVWVIDDAAKAKRDWLKNTDLIQARRRNKNIAGEKEVQVPEATGLMSLGEAQRHNEIYKLKMAELKYNEQAGLLVPKETVQKEAFELGRKVRDNILNVPGRVAHELAAEVDPHRVEVQLMRELTQALEELTNLD